MCVYIYIYVYVYIYIYIYAHIYIYIVPDLPYMFVFLTRGHEAVRCLPMDLIPSMAARARRNAEVISSALNKAAPLMTYLNTTTYYNVRFAILMCTNDSCCVKLRLLEPRGVCHSGRGIRYQTYRIM